MSKEEKKTTNAELYEMYIEPNMKNMVETLIKFYINKYSSHLYFLYDDILSEVKSNFIAYIHTYDPTKDLKNWIHIVTKRETIRFLKNHQKEESMYTGVNNNIFIDNAADDDFYFGGVEPEDPLDMEWYRNHLSDDLYEALMMLEDKFRAAFLLRHIGRYTIKEIAQMEMDRGTQSWASISGIKTRIKVSIEKIKANLKTIQERKNESE